mgnify:CR=1 FL=1
MAKEKKELIVGVNGDLSDNFTTGQKAVLGLQNTLAMCGVILVPILCGLDVSVTLFCGHPLRAGRHSGHGSLLSAVCPAAQDPG